MVEESVEISSCLARTPPFSALSEEKLRVVAGESRKCVYPAGRYIFSEGDEPSAGWVIVSGRVALLKSSPAGKELIIQLFGPHEAIGVIAAGNRATFPASARAQVATKLISIPERVIRTLADEEPEFQRESVAMVQRRMRRVQELARAVAHDSLEQRIAAALLSLSGDPPAVEDGIELNITRKEIADYVGTTIESASRVMRAFEKRGIVSLRVQRRVSIRSLHQLRQARS